MKSAGAIQVAIILLLVASAASCEVAKEYSSRVFKPPVTQNKTDSTVMALRFMQFDSDNVSDSIDLKDFANKEINETDRKELIKDSTKTEQVVLENKKPLRDQPVGTVKSGTTRTKRIRQ